MPDVILNALITITHLILIMALLGTFSILIIIYIVQMRKLRHGKVRLSKLSKVI